MKRRTGIIVALLLVVSFLGLHAEETLNNAAVIDLHKLGLGDTVIVNKINTSKCDFDTSVNGLKTLKAAGVSDAVMAAMISTKDTTKETASAPAGDPNDPKAVHEPGIWLCTEIGGKTEMKKVEPSIISKMETGSAWGAGFGGSMKSRAILTGSHSNFQISEHRPTFYFYFDVTQTSLSQAESAVTSPNEFTLAKIEVKEKDNKRRLIVGKFNAYSGGKSGPDEKQLRAFDFEKVSKGVYKVTPKEDLDAGEYCFFYAGATPLVGYGVVMGGSGGKLYDFGIGGMAGSAASSVK